MEKLLLFRIGNRQFGMNLPLIRSIYKTDAFFEKKAEKRGSDEMVQVPDLNQQSETLFIDGKEIPLYDLSLLLSEGSAVSDSDGERVMLIDIHGHFIAIKVDRVANVVSVAGDRIEPLPPVFGNPSLIYFPRVLKQADTLILILDPDGIEKIRHKKEILEETSEFLIDSEVSEEPVAQEEDFSSTLHEAASSPILEPTSPVPSDDLNLIRPAIIKSIKAFGKKAEEIKSEEMEALLTLIVQEEIIADIIIRHLKKIIERAVLLEIKKIKKSLWEVKNEK